ncbi:MAG: hypothetical protein ACP5OV_07080 [Acidimicrobiales bacterium]
MIDPWFLVLAGLLSVAGIAGYVRDVLRGSTAPNRVTWALWGLEGLLIFVVEVQQHVGPAAIMTLVFGLIPLVVVVASLPHRHGRWQLGPFDLVCGVASVVGLVTWALIRDATAALVVFVVADQLASLPTVRKAWLAPKTETAWTYLTGVVNTAVTIMVLHRWTTAGVAFPGAIFVTDLVIWALVSREVGPRMRGEAVAVA